MARYYARQCEGCRKITTQKFLGHDDEGLEVLSCEECGLEGRKRTAVVSKKKTTWPYYHEGCGVRFESESHEQKYAKAHNLTKD